MTQKMLSFGADGVQFAWDSTSISLAQTCLRKYQYKMLEGWQSASLSVHLRFGQHYASALEHFYKRTALGEDFEDALRAIVEEVLEATWDRTTDEDGNETGGAPWDSLHNLKTRENLVRTIVWYIDHFEEDPAPVVILSDGKPAVEHSFALPVDNGLIFSGHIDRLVNYQSHVFVMDQKTTTSTLSPYYFDQFKPNVQMSMYSFAGKIIYGSPIKGIIIDAAQIAVGFSKFARDMTFRTEEELTEWYDSSMYWIEQAQRATRENYFPMNPASCGNYGGCEFRKICSKTPEFRKPFLEGNFEKGERWDPLKVR
jgi:hypothetical protein